MPTDIENIALIGRIGITCVLRAKTGLAIGAAEARIQIGGIDETVIRDPMTRRPYVPASSLKGKLRALSERALGKKLVPVIPGRDRMTERAIHRCETEEEYSACEVCHLYGTARTATLNPLPTRLIVRDAFLVNAEEMAEKPTELPFTEVKTEATLDRLTSASTPRLRERVPAGARFGVEFTLNCYRVNGNDRRDYELLKHLLAGMSLLEGDYLGGHGSRGYGQVVFEEIEVKLLWNRGLPGDAVEEIRSLAEFRTLSEILELTGNPLGAR